METTVQNTKAPETALHEHDLRHFTGSENWYRHSIYRSFLYTDGVQYVAEKGGAYWLIDKIFAEQFEIPNLSEQEFQAWILSVQEDKSALLTCHDGNYNSLHKETIAYTDFPMKEIKFYFQNNVLLLTSEY